MAGSNMIGNLAVNLTMSTAAFENGAKRAEKRAATLQSKMAGIGSSIKSMSAGLAIGAGAAAVAGLAAIAKNAFEMGSALTESASKVGVTVEALQEMRYVAEQNGVAVETMDSSLNKMSKTLGELQLGNKTTAATFKELGLSAQQMVGLTPTESFTKIVDALGKIEDETIRAALGNKVFGREYAELKPLVDLGAAGIRKAAEEKRKDGVLSTEQAAKLDDLADGWDKLTGRLGVAAAQFIANQAGSTNASAGLDQFGESIGGVIKEIEKLLSYSRQIGTFFNNLEIKLQTRMRDSAITSWIPGVSEQAQKEINRLNATNQRNSSNGGGRTGVRGGTGRVIPRTAPGGALAGTMSGIGAIDIGSVLDKLDAKAATVDAKVAAPVKKAVEKISASFKQLRDDVEPLLDRLFPEVRDLLDYKADQNTLEKWAKAGKISADQLRESLIRLRDSYYGTDGPVALTQAPDIIENITDTLPDLADVTNKMAGRIKKSNDEISRSFADSATDVLGSIDNMARSIKGGGLLGILDGIAGLFMTLGSVGTFGSNIASRINAPGRARGGNMTSNRSYLVGERGPEILTMGGRSGYMTANNDFGGGGRASNISIIPSPYFNVVVDGRADGRINRAAPGIATASAQGVQTNMAQAQYRAIP